ncbi:hypothetical protein L218DRAFT_1010434 [Marasmius fiardii PR-910]|nr:hypothetical protein L218DRAFT_1010434 [Marasmius fiardii PR-910]
MPSPPDVYTFKRRLFLLVPENMAQDMTEIHRVTAESSSVNDIMQAALSCERSNDAEKYYQRVRESAKSAKRRRSRSRSKERRRREEKRRNSRSPSPRRLQKVDNRRYSVKPHSQNRPNRPDWPKHMGSSSKNFAEKVESTQKRADSRRKFEKKPDFKNGNKPSYFRDNRGRMFQLFEISESPEGNENPSEPVMRLKKKKSARGEACRRLRSQGKY